MYVAKQTVRLYKTFPFKPLITKINEHSFFLDILYENPICAKQKNTLSLPEKKNNEI